MMKFLIIKCGFSGLKERNLCADQNQALLGVLNVFS